MAFDVKKIDPLDLQPRKAVGVNLPFSGQAVFNSTYQTKDAIKANLINYFLTNKGERYLNPNFGSDIRLLLFENLTQEKVDNLKLTISRELELYFPRVVPKVFEITGNPDLNSFRVYLRYELSSTNIEDEILINIQQ